MRITWIWPAPGDWNMPEPEGTPLGVSRIWSPIRPINILDADISNYTPFPITHSYSASPPFEEHFPVTKIKSFYTLVAPFIVSGGVIYFATEFISDSPIESSVILGGQLLGRGDRQSSIVKINSSFHIAGGGITNATVEPGSHVEATLGNLDRVKLNIPLQLLAGGYLRVAELTLNNVATFADENSRMQVSSETAGLDSLLNITEGGVVRGCGQMLGGLVENRGLISANVRDKVFDFMTGRLNNHNRIEAVDGCTIYLRTLLVGSEGCVVSAVTGQVVAAGILTNEAIIKGVIRTEGTGLTINHSWHNYLRNAVINGPCRMVTAGLVQVGGTTLNGPFSLDGASSIRIESADPAAPPVLTIGEPGSMRGEGEIIMGTIENHGEINADTNGKTLKVSCRINNRGRLQAFHGGTLLLQSLVVGVEGSLIAAVKEGVVIADRSIFEGVMATQGTGITFNSAWENRLHRATINGPISLGEAGRVHVSDTTLNGPANMDGQACDMWIWPEPDAEAHLIVGPNGRIRGCGIVHYGKLENRGVISADMNGTMLRVVCDLQNYGRLEAINGGTLVLQAITTGKPDSVIAAHSGGTVFLDGVVTGEMKTEGSGLTIGNSWNNHIVDATIEGPITLPSPCRVNIARTTLNGIAEFSGDHALMDIMVDNGPSVLTFGEAGGARGFGSIFGSMGGLSDVENHGTITANTGGKMLNMNGVRMTNNHATGRLEITPGAMLSLRSSTNHGTFQIAPEGIAYVGAMTQYDGLTNVDGTLNMYSTESPFVLAGGALTGSGTINGFIVNRGGTMKAGNSPGILRVAGNYEQTPKGELHIELDGPEPQTGHNQLQVTGSATLGGTLRINLGEFRPEEGSVYTIITHGGHTGEFGEVVSADPAYRFQVVYNPNDVQIVAQRAGWRLPKS